MTLQAPCFLPICSFFPIQSQEDTLVAFTTQRGHLLEERLLQCAIPNRSQEGWPLIIRNAPQEFGDLPSREL